MAKQKHSKRLFPGWDLDEPRESLRRYRNADRHVVSLDAASLSEYPILAKTQWIKGEWPILEYASGSQRILRNMQIGNIHFSNKPQELKRGGAGRILAVRYFQNKIEIVDRRQVYEVRRTEGGYFVAQGVVPNCVETRGLYHCKGVVPHGKRVVRKTINLVRKAITSLRV